MPLRRDALLDRLEPLRHIELRPPLSYGIAAVAVALATLLRHELGVVSGVGPFVTYLLPVIISTVVGRIWVGLFAVVLSLSIADYLFLAPTYAHLFNAAHATAIALAALNFVVIVVVISLLQNLLDRLWRQENNFRFMLDAQPVGLIAVDQAGNITMVNRAIEQLLGHTTPELIDHAVECVLPERYRAAHIGHRADYMKNARPRLMGAGAELYALHRDGSEVPVEIGLNPIERDGRRGTLATVIDIAARKNEEQRREILVREIQHRGKNLLSVVRALASRVLTPQRAPDDARTLFMSVSDTLARTQDLYATSAAAGLHELVDGELSPFKDAVTVWGDDIWLTPSAAQNLSLILHELCTNAVKHGALSSPEGHISVTWDLQKGDLHFTWTEIGGPPVSAPTHKGFGQTILVALPKGLGAEATLKYEVSGLSYCLTIKQTLITEQKEGVRTERANLVA